MLVGGVRRAHNRLREIQPAVASPWILPRVALPGSEILLISGISCQDVALTSAVLVFRCRSKKRGRNRICILTLPPSPYGTPRSTPCYPYDPLASHFQVTPSPTPPKVSKKLTNTETRE